MSHFTRVKTKINDLGALCEALDKIGHKYTIAPAGKTVTVRGFMGNTVQAKIAIHAGKYDIGVVIDQDGGELVADWYEMVADWWGVESTMGKTEAEVVEEICRQYACVRVIAACAAEGFDVSDVEDMQDGGLQMVASKWN